jgi:hypothetical protein
MRFCKTVDMIEDRRERGGGGYLCGYSLIKKEEGVGVISVVIQYLIKKEKT